MKKNVGRFFAVCLTATIASGAVMAADLPARAPAPAPMPVAVPVFTWSGFYVGVSGGYGGDKFVYPASVSSAVNLFVPITAQASVTSSGFLFGGTVGYNYQFSSGLVAGVEADWSWANIDGRLGLGINVPILGLTAAANAGSKITQVGTVRGRLGYAWDRAMIYATGGWAWGSVRSSGTVAIPALGFTGTLARTNNISGWVIGAGLEYALTQNLSFKTEYLYINFGKQTLYAATYPFFGGINANLGMNTKLHVVRAGLNYRFNWGAPSSVVARY